MELAVLRALRLKGRVDLNGLVAATGGDRGGAEDVVSELIQSGAAREVSGNYVLLPGGRERLAALLDAERELLDAGALSVLYERFTHINGDFKQLAADWQLRDGEPNDHSDAAYDQSVLDRLPAIHERVAPILERVVELVPWLAPYPDRLHAALERVQAGDHAWLLRPFIDSYHTVWFELHEEMIGLAGLSRHAEAAAGRAD